MQESLKLIQIPDVDTSRLSSVGAFRRTVEQIERNWNLNLEFNDNARWRPGSYERLKGQVTNALFPHWSKPKGANTIRRLTKNSHYNCNQLANDLILIDTKLRDFRRNKESLNEEQAAIEGKNLLNEYMQRLTTPVDGIKIEILPLPYWTKTRRSLKPIMGRIYEPNWDSPLHPLIERNGEIRNYNLTNSEVNKRLQVYSENRNPQRWFINIIIPLKDVDINYYANTDNDTLIATNHYGDLVVGFTMPLFDAILNYRTIKSLSGLRITGEMLERRIDYTYYSNNTFKFPYVSSIQHPFVHGNSNRYSYQWGNTCFGGFRSDVLIALSTGMMGHLKIILDKWATTYHLGNTTPLNQPNSHHLGMPNKWKNSVTGLIGTDTNLCRKAINNGMEESYLLDNFCNDCQLTEAKSGRNICNYYIQLTRVPIPMPSELKRRLDDIMEYRGLPGNKKEQFTWVEAKTVLLDMTEKLWKLVTSNPNCGIEEITTLYKCNDFGAGNLNWSTFTGIVEDLKLNILAPEEEMDYKCLALNAYLIFRYCERVYWLGSIATYDEDLWNITSENYYATINKAEEKIPISSYRMMVNTHRISNNQRLYTEYYKVLSDNINPPEEGGSNEPGPF